MTVRRFPTLFCDADESCGEWADVDSDVGMHYTAHSLRRAARRLGWTRTKVDGQFQDRCPIHRLPVSNAQRLAAEIRARLNADPALGVCVDQED